MNDRTTVTSVWLIPCPEDAARYQRVIDTLAARLSAPSFLPHVSLGSLQSEIETDQALIARLKGLSLEPIELATSPRFTMSLFVRLQATPQLQRARDWLEGQSGFVSSRPFEPHISLCYGPPPDHEDLNVEMTALASRRIRFERLAMMRIALPVQAPVDIAGWRQQALYALA